MPSKAEQPLQNLELQEKEAQKTKHMKKMKAYMKSL